MESLGDYCVVCGQLIHAGEISVTLVYQKAHQRCSENGYTTRWDSCYQVGIQEDQDTMIAKFI